jgi:glycosyltransferase involved in cell wall biosynthesis
MSPVIFYFVDEIESTFVLNDLVKIAEKYETVYLFSIDKLDGKEKLPDNIQVIEEFIEWKNFSPFKILGKHFFSILGIYISESIALKRLLPFKSATATLGSNIFKANEVMRHIRQSSIPFSQSTFYSFWFYDCIYLAWLKKRGIIKFAVSRAHSGDLYEQHISITGKNLFRNFQFRYLNGVFPISNTGTVYLRNKYRFAESRIRTIFLGSKDPGTLNPYNDARLVMVSCASLRHHKRIHKIAEALFYMDIPVTWHHFGSENLHANDPKIAEYLARKADLKTKTNIEYIVHGYTSNEKLYEFYKTVPVNLFVSLSEAEGIPVSMMEAASFGIPILSTDVGGCKEIVNEQTGILIPLETEARDIAKIISTFRDSSKNTEAYRKNVRKFWENHFDEETNYKELFKQLS